MEPTPSTHAINNKMDEIKALWTKHNQGHVFQWADKLSDEQKMSFLEDVQQVDITEVNRIYKETVEYEGMRLTQLFSIVLFI